MLLRRVEKGTKMLIGTIFFLIVLFLLFIDWAAKKMQRSIPQADDCASVYPFDTTEQPEVIKESAYKNRATIRLDIPSSKTNTPSDTVLFRTTIANPSNEERTLTFKTTTLSANFLGIPQRPFYYEIKHRDCVVFRQNRCYKKIRRKKRHTEPFHPDICQLSDGSRVTGRYNCFETFYQTLVLAPKEEKRFEYAVPISKIKKPSLVERGIRRIFSTKVRYMIRLIVNIDPNITLFDADASSLESFFDVQY